jgi:general secretion pathway protein D
MRSQQSNRFYLMTSKVLARPVLTALLVMLSLASPSLWAEDKLTMNMRNADIRSLIQWVADNTGKNIIVHKAVEGQVTVLSPSPLTSEEAYQVFLSVLQIHGYAAVETDQALKIIPKSLAASGGLPYAGSHAADDMVVTIIKVENVSAATLATTIRPLMSKEAVINAFAATNALVIADHAANINSAQQLISQLDQAGDSEIELITLQHADAASVLQSLSALIGNNSGQDKLGITLSTDERSNSVLMAGDPTKRKQFKRLIQQLDTPLNGQGNAQVIYLHYVDAAEIAPILKSLADSIQSGQKDNSSKISIESSESANALVINAPPTLLANLKQIISQLDIRRAQVLVEALVVEVSGDIANDIGVTWITDPDNEFIGAVNTLGDLPLANVSADDSSSLNPARGFTFGYFNNGDLQAALRALNSSQNANILSTPTIVAIDNEEASLLVGQNVPFITGQSTSSASSTADPFTTIERQDIGISLVVTPRINQGDSITLEIQQKTETIAPSVDIASDIITNKREIITKALIKDDQVLVLGGLISDEETEVREKVPFLGDIPLLGRLFSSTGTNHSKTNLMVFIHPTILKDEEHIKSITQSRYNFMRDLQQQVKDKEWKVKPNDPTIMDDFNAYSPDKP